MVGPARQLVELLLPRPKQALIAGGVCRIGPACRINILAVDPRIERFVLGWRNRFSARSHIADGVKPGVTEEYPNNRPIGRLLVAADPQVVDHPQGYKLSVRPDGVELIGGGREGCYWGLQTLSQLSDFEGGTVAGCTIEDRPDFATRGLLHDITRGKVPTLETLKMLVDRLSGLKINQLHLNIEHAFVFSFDPEICSPQDGLTPDEVRELDAYARERFVDLVPALATFGHMGRILSMERYRHLAEIEATKPWAAMDWHERMRGLTLDCMNPESFRLVESMWTDVLDAFSSPVVNICGDEPWDLGKGKNIGKMTSESLGEAYANRLRATHELCAKKGIRTQFWSDVVKNQPHLPAGLDDSTVLHWGYDDRADYDKTGVFVRAGLRTHVCPGTSGWKRIINAMDLAERNIAAFALAGKKRGATGLLNTDWGDHGHFNLLACSLHGIALGAALGWEADHPTGTAFDDVFTKTVLGVDDSSGVGLLRKASALGDGCETWRLLWTPLRELAHEPNLPDWDELNESQEAADTAHQWCRSLVGPSSPASSDLEELATACEFHALLAEKIRLMRGDPSEPRERWIEKLKSALTRYEKCWNARNKPSGLGDIVRVLQALKHEVASATSATRCSDT